MAVSRDSIDILLSAPEYNYKLNKLLTNIIKKVKNAPNEDTLADIFDKNIYFLVRDYFKTDVTVIREVNDGIIGNSFENSFIGRMDYVSNKLIIEFKHWSKLKTTSDIDKADKQVLKYMEQLKDENYTAVLTDGLQIRYYYYNDNVLKRGSLHDLTVADLDFIIRALLVKDNKKFNSFNIVSDFKIDSTTQSTKLLSKSLFKCLKNNFTDKTAMLFNEWKTLFHLSDNDNGKNDDIRKRRFVLSNIFEESISDNENEYLSLFALQTAYAIILKLVACKILTNVGRLSEVTYFSELSKISSDDLRLFLERMEDGYSLPIGGIYNLFEGDFFSWYCSNEQWNNNYNLYLYIKNIISVLDDYTVMSFSHEFEAVDVFKDLYMSVIPKEIRHSLGEYFTPAWIADGVVKNAIIKANNQKWKGIDPCCGSGIFLISMIKKIMGEVDIISLTDGEKSILLKEIISRVKGIDINPLSVLTARTNYFLAIAPLIGNNKIEIPVYLGDSANIPQKINLDGVDCFQYYINTIKGSIEIVLPVSLIADNEFISKMSSIQSLIRTGDKDLVSRRLMNIISKDSQNHLVVNKIHELSKRLTELHKNKWDDIWVRIATNFMLIAKINNIDIIVGNPPWVKWEFLPTNYAEKLKHLCNEKHMFSGQSYMGAISLNICAAIANITASAWLRKNGVLAFLMPKTIMTQDSYEGFRNFYIDYINKKRLYLESVDDWSESGNPFIDIQEKFLTYYFKHQKIDYSDGIPVKKIIKANRQSMQKINLLRRYDDVINKYYKITEWHAVQYDKNRTGFTFIQPTDDFTCIIGNCEYKVRTGAEFTPAEVYFITPKEKSNDTNCWKFENRISKASKYKVISSVSLDIETTYIKPLLRGPNVKKFKMIESNEYCIFPYESDSINAVGIEELSEASPKLLDYLIQYKNLVEKQSERSKMYNRGQDFYSLSKIGLYTFAQNKVAFRDNTSLDAVVVTPIQTPWGKKELPVCPKHAPFISTDIYGDFITEDESYYICGILNTDIVGAYFCNSFDKRTFSFKKINIKLPKYNANNKAHKLISDLSKIAHKKLDDVDLLLKQIQIAYLNICDEIK